MNAEERRLALEEQEQIIARHLGPPRGTPLPDDPVAVTLTVEELTMALVRSLEREIVHRAVIRKISDTVVSLERSGNGLGIACNYLVDRLLERPCECWEGSEDKCWRCTVLAGSQAILTEWS